MPSTLWTPQPRPSSKTSLTPDLKQHPPLPYPPAPPPPIFALEITPALGSIVILGNKLSSYGDRLLDARARTDPTNALLRAGPLLRDIDLLPYPSSDSARWRRDVERLPRLERAFNDLALTFSAPETRGSAAGVESLRDQPLEFVEAADGELITGRAAGANAA